MPVSGPRCIVTQEISPPCVVVTGTGLAVEAKPGDTLLSCLRRAGLGVESTCNGRGACGKCKVIVHGALSPPDEKEREHLTGVSCEVRLACMAKVMGKVEVTLDDAWTQLKTIYGVEERTVEPRSLVKRTALPALQSNSPRPYEEGLFARTMDPHVLNKIASWDWGRGRCSGIVFGEELLDIVPESTPLLGSAVDVGTTSVSLCVYNLETGELLGRASALNPQTAYGGDVITRIAYCRQEPRGLITLRETLTAKLAEMMDSALGSQYNREQVYLVTIAANTTMLHILAGVQPLSLATSPFRPIFLKPLILTGDQSGLPMYPGGRAIFLPSVSAYIGADIVAGLAAIDCRSRSRNTLFLDMGTNGEIVLIQEPDRMVAASCAMGPALEGMNISCGCRAVPGAIDSFALDGNHTPHFTTIGDLPPLGICGSGLIDVVASLLEARIILPGGAYNQDADTPLRDSMKGNRYHLSDNVFLSQHDIRQLQLAKGAAIAGILLLLEESGMTTRDIEEIILAGAFGYHVNLESLKRIGLLPHDYCGPVRFVGNSSLTGASFALLNEDAMAEVEAIPSRVRVLELSSHPRFSGTFVDNLLFPEHQPLA